MPEAELGAAAPGDTNRLVIGPQNSLTWNGAPIDPVRLRQYLDLTAMMRPRPVLATRLDPAADPALVGAVHDAIDRALTCRAARL